MRSILFAGLFAAVTLAQLAWAPLARADGLIYKLPKDGEQVRYEMEIAASIGGQDVTTKGSVTVSSVGQSTVDNEKCRCRRQLEIRTQEQRSDSRRRNVQTDAGGHEHDRPERIAG